MTWSFPSPDALPCFAVLSVTRRMVNRIYTLFRTGDIEVHHRITCILPRAPYTCSRPTQPHFSVCVSPAVIHCPSPTSSAVVFCPLLTCSPPSSPCVFGCGSASGQLSSAEFLSMFSSDSDSPFLRHLFDVIDSNSDSTLTFAEYHPHGPHTPHRRCPPPLHSALRTQRAAHA